MFELFPQPLRWGRKFSRLKISGYYTNWQHLFRKCTWWFCCIIYLGTINRGSSLWDSYYLPHVLQSTSWKSSRFTATTDERRWSTASQHSKKKWRGRAEDVMPRTTLSKKKYYWFFQALASLRWKKGRTSLWYGWGTWGVRVENWKHLMYFVDIISKCSGRKNAFMVMWLFPPHYSPRHGSDAFLFYYVIQKRRSPICFQNTSFRETPLRVLIHMTWITMGNVHAR